MDKREKLFYFRYFFTGRDDVYAERTSNGGRYFLIREKLTDDALIRHMRGQVMLGSYPLQLDGTTRWVAVDFDNHNDNATEHTKIFVDTLRSFDIEPMVNTSQSGRGYHVRLIFDDPSRDPMIGKKVTGAVARRFMLSMLECAELPRLNKGGAWDRVFPSQDKLITPKSIGNQIGMPMSKVAALSRGGTLLLDRQLKPIPLGDATWDAIEMYKLVQNLDLFDAVQTIGKLGFVYGDVNDSGELVYENAYGSESIGNRNKTNRSSHKDMQYMIRNCDFMVRVSHGDIPYFMWVALASVLAVFDNVGGRAEFQRISSLDCGVSSKGRERYDSAVADQKYDNVRNNFRTPITCKRLADDGWVCPSMDSQGICKKFRRKDGRGARTPATAPYFAPREIHGSHGAKRVA